MPFHSFTFHSIRYALAVIPLHDPVLRQPVRRNEMIHGHLGMIENRMPFLLQLAEQPGLFTREQRIALAAQLQREQADIEYRLAHRHVGPAR